MQHNFKKLDIWKESLELACQTYRLTKKLPDSEKFGLVSQVNRSAVSIPSNISEGSSRKSIKDFSRFLDIALGSCYELETQLLIIQNVFPEFVKNTIELNSKNIIIQRKIGSFKKKIQS